MILSPAWPQVLDFFGTPVVIEPSPGQPSSDAGLLPVRQFDERIGLPRAFADALDDPRDPDLTEHSFLEMVRSRIYGILAGYEDQNDHDTLRCDPVFKLVADRSPDDSDLASQPTLSRFENAISIKSLKRLRDVFLDQFIASFGTPPRHLTFDLDAVDDPAHGHQQLTFWHGYHDQNQYLPLVFTCADNDQFVMLSLRPGNVHAALGADDDLAYLVARLRQVWPDVALHFRGDCGFGVPGMYEVCERLRVSYTFGLSTNVVLQHETEGLLAEAVAGYERKRQAARHQDPPRPAVPSRLFTGFWYQAGTWPQPRWVVARVEANGRGTNRRFVVTNRPGAVACRGRPTTSTLLAVRARSTRQTTTQTTSCTGPGRPVTLEVKALLELARWCQQQRATQQGGLACLDPANDGLPPAPGRAPRPPEPLGPAAPGQPPGTRCCPGPDDRPVPPPASTEGGDA